MISICERTMIHRPASKRGFLAIVIWHQFDQAEIDGDHQREGESPVVPASFVTACLVIFCVLLGANVLACLEKQGNVAKKISTFITESPRRAQAAAIKGKLISLGACTINLTAYF